MSVVLMVLKAWPKAQVCLSLFYTVNLWETFRIKVHFFDMKRVVFTVPRFSGKPQRKFSKPTDLRWAAKRIRKSAHKFTHVAKTRKFHAYTVTCEQLVSTCVEWPNGEKLASTCVRIWARPKSTQATKVNASGWPNETQVERKSKTCVDLPSPFGRS